MARRKRRKTYSERQKEDLLAQQKHRCYYCDDRFKGSGDKNKAPTFEHLDKRAEGGTWHDSNIVLACKECNSHRGDVSPEEWKVVCKEVIQERKKRDFMKTDKFDDLLRYKGAIPRIRVKMRVIEVIGGSKC